MCSYTFDVSIDRLVYVSIDRLIYVSIDRLIDVSLDRRFQRCGDSQKHNLFSFFQTTRSTEFLRKKNGSRRDRERE